MGICKQMSVDVKANEFDESKYLESLERLIF